MQIRNVEIKLSLEDGPAAREAIARVADGPPEVLEQRDSYLEAEGGYLKLREENGSATLVAYRRSRDARPRPSDIRLMGVEDPDTLLDTLGAVLAPGPVVVKRRELSFRGQTRIHLDEVDELGWFLELEVVLEPGQSDAEGLEIAERLLEDLSLSGARAQRESYRDLLVAARGD